MGNICRSPTAEAVLRHMAREMCVDTWVEVDSAGTHDYHVGEPPDERAISVGARRGYDLSSLRARQLIAEDFDRFDVLLAMDRQNLAAMRRLGVGRMGLLLDYAPELNTQEVPDPYYGNLKDFERVLDLVEIAARGVLSSLGQIEASKVSR